MIGGVHPRVLGYLGRALSLEYSALQQYMTHASLAALWGQAETADRFRRETVEEMRHAERLIGHMLTLGVAPAASQLRPVRAAGDLDQLLRLNIEGKEGLIQHYAEAARFCTLIRDGENGSFFADLLDEERRHGEDLETWLWEVDRMGGGHLAERARF